jgi:sarcosine oxidase subunit gamma
MFDLSASSTYQSPLHHLGLTARAKPVDQHCGVWAHEITASGYVILRGRSDDAPFVEAAARALGMSLPTTPCTLAASGAEKCLWLSPDEWMIVCPRGGVSSVIRNLETALHDHHSQVVDNSSGVTEIAVKGRNADAVLAHCTVYDLGKLKSGHVVGTTFGKSSVYLYRDGEGFVLTMRRSFADYIWRFLERAATPYGFGIASKGPC